MKLNIPLISFAAATVTFLTITACSQGYSLDGLLKMPVNEGIREATGSDSRITIAEAVYVRDEYVTDVERNLRSFDEAYADATWLRDGLGSLLNVGVVAGEGALAGLPGGALLSSFLALGAGVFINKPGTQKKTDEQRATLQKEKDALWDEAAEATARLIKEGQDRA